ncbi:MAG: class I tRNA ligase family protein, partial [Candidatus Berkelbacteria bacterium]|nr:class I tRNA ligase family protein [Candidatus Berkelbacteria bacterium]
MEKYYPSKIEPKWQKIWEEKGLNKTDLSKKGKFYCLVMFPYPSGDKLHVGHWYNFGPVDTYARKKKMEGFNVFEPMGFDSFGLPAENYAIKTKISPEKSTEDNIAYIIKQLKQIGAMYDWSKVLYTSHPDYYKWTQWLFLQLYKKGLAYRAKAPVNFCPSCQTVLANEQVIEGLCERCDTEVEQKYLEQWFFKITDYSEKLLDCLKKLDWPEESKRQQENWIGKSEGATVRFEIENRDREYIEVFTTRPDTLFGATYMVVAPEKWLEICEKYDINVSKDVENYIKKTKNKSYFDRQYK